MYVDDPGIIVIVVTYNRKEMLLKSLEAILAQTLCPSAVLIVDNASTDQTPLVLQQQGYITELPVARFAPVQQSKTLFSETHNRSVEIIYVRMHVNTCGAGGFHEGIKRGVEAGYEWVWIMDDDVRPEKRCLETLFQYRTSAYKVLVPLRVNERNEIRELSAQWFDLHNPFISDPNRRNVINEYLSSEQIPPCLELQTFSFEGPLISRDVIERVGYPDPHLYIFGDDVDYALRIRYSGNMRIGLISQALLYRMIDENTKFRIDWHWWKTYYWIRNNWHFHIVYGENIAVKLKVVWLAVRLFLYHTLKKREVSVSMIKIIYFAFIDAWKKEMPVRFTPGEEI
jgi:GT2 family glycosyltransferase